MSVTLEYDQLQLNQSLVNIFVFSPKSLQSKMFVHFRHLEAYLILTNLLVFRQNCLSKLSPKGSPLMERQGYHLENKDGELSINIPAMFSPNVWEPLTLVDPLYSGIWSNIL